MVSINFVNHLKPGWVEFLKYILWKHLGETGREPENFNWGYQAPTGKASIVSICMLAHPNVAGGLVGVLWAQPPQAWFVGGQAP